MGEEGQGQKGSKWLSLVLTKTYCKIPSKVKGCKKIKKASK